MKFNKSKLINMILDFIVLLQFINFPDYILIGPLKSISKYFSIIIFFLILIIYIYRNKGISKQMIEIISLTTIIYMIPIGVTIVNKNYSEVFYGSKILVGTISSILIVDYNVKIRPKEFLHSFITFFGIMNFMNILSFYLYYPSMDSIQLYFYFLGNDNGSIYESMLYIFASIFYYIKFNNNKIPVFFWIMMLFIFSGYVFVESGNGMSCMILIMIFLLFRNNKKISKIFSPKLFLWVYALIFIMIVCFRNLSFMQPVLDILGKSSTLTGRTDIWDKCIKYINDSLIWGNGYEPVLYVISKIGNVKAHNIILQYLYNGGIIMTLLFGFLNFKILKKVNKIEVDYISRLMINVSIFLFFIVSLFDFYIQKYTYIFMIIIYYCYIVNLKKGEYQDGK